ncbi:MAG: hypothetical protein ACTMKY_00070 [Dermabacteraceae bacterium]
MIADATRPRRRTAPPWTLRNGTDVQLGRLGRTTSACTGERELKKSPIAPAQTAKHQLITYLNDASSTPIGRAVHLEALPCTELPGTWDRPEAPRALVLDAPEWWSATAARSGTPVAAWCGNGSARGDLPRHG